jgi:hypothetical protein
VTVPTPVPPSPPPTTTTTDAPTASVVVKGNYFYSTIFLAKLTHSLSQTPATWVFTTPKRHLYDTHTTPTTTTHLRDGWALAYSPFNVSFCYYSTTQIYLLMFDQQM